MPTNSEDIRLRTLREHTELGQHKAVSYLPIHTVNRYLKGGVAEYKRISEASGNKVYVCYAPISVIESGAVHVFNNDVLHSILAENKTLLLNGGWPIEPLEFIERLAREWVEDNNPVITVIRKFLGINADSDPRAAHRMTLCLGAYPPEA